MLSRSSLAWQWVALVALLIGEVPAYGQAPAAKAPAGQVVGAAKAKADPATDSGGSKVDRASLLKLAANPMMIPLGLCSIAAVGFALERWVALRRSRVIPADFVERFVERVSNGKLDRDRAVELCRANESPVARIFARVVGYWGQPAAAIRLAMGQDAAGELADLRRNVRVLNATATLAPLLGLLGTVFGMIESFDAVAHSSSSGGARGGALAHGISLALGATAFGLVVAAFSVTAYYFLLNRLDVVIRDLDAQTRRVIDLVAAEPPTPRSTVGERREFPPRHEPRPSSLGRTEAV